MRAPLLLVATGCLLGTQAPAAEASPASWERSLTSLRELPGQYRLENEITIEEIAAGVQRGDWTEEEAVEARSWLQLVFRPSRIGSSVLGTISAPVSFFVTRMPSPQYDASRPVGFLKTSLAPRFSALMARHSNISAEVLILASHFATEQWLTARTPAELQSAQRILQETLAEFREGILAPRIPLSSMSGQPLTYTATDQFLDVYCLIHPDPPFLFPDPAKEPTAFRESWRQHLALRTTERYRFFGQPEVARYLERQRTAYESAAAEALATLDRLVLEDAPIDSLEAALHRTAAFKTLGNESVAYSPDQFRRPFPPSPPGAPEPPDYRTLAKPWLEQNPGSSSDAHQQKMEGYGQWVIFRQAEAARASDNMVARAEFVRRELPKLTPPIAEHMARRLESPRFPPQPAKPAESAVQELHAQLAMEALKPGQHRSSLDALARRWAGLIGGEPSTNEETEDSASLWLELARRDSRHVCFQLREKALRELLPAPERPTDDAATPLSTQLRDLLNKALAAGDTTAATRLVAIDAAGALLPQAERRSTQQTLRQLSAARAHMEAGRIAEARFAFRTIIGSAPPPGGAEFAVQSLKRLSKTPTQSPATVVSPP